MFAQVLYDVHVSTSYAGYLRTSLRHMIGGLWPQCSGSSESATLPSLVPPQLDPLFLCPYVTAHTLTTIRVVKETTTSGILAPILGYEVLLNREGFLFRLHIDLLDEILQPSVFKIPNVTQHLLVASAQVSYAPTISLPHVEWGTIRILEYVGIVLAHAGI